MTVRLRTLLLSVLLALFCAGAAQAQKGHLLLIGGGERDELVMRKFIELSGGSKALFLVIPTASEEPDTGARYVAEFKSYGCKNVRVLDIITKEDATHGDWEALVPQAGGIFFTGGDQVRIMRACEETPFARAVREAYERGAVIGGTSAGTACMSTPMITGEGQFNVIRAGATETTNGLGMLPGIIVDQHFLARQRENRLITVVAEHPELLGVGVDEATAIWLRPDRTFQVLGEGSVMIIDARKSKISRGYRGNLGLRDVRMHVLLPGDIWHLDAAPVEPATQP